MSTSSKVLLSRKQLTCLHFQCRRIVQPVPSSSWIQHTYCYNNNCQQRFLSTRRSSKKKYRELRFRQQETDRAVLQQSSKLDQQSLGSLDWRYLAFVMLAPIFAFGLRYATADDDLRRKMRGLDHEPMEAGMIVVRSRPKGEVEK